MDLFSQDENEKFKLNFFDDIIVDLESLFEKIRNLSLPQNDKRKFEFDDDKKAHHEFNIKKIDNNSYKLQKYSINQETFQEIELFEKVNLIKDNAIYPIYSEFQVNYLLEKKLNVKECTYYLMEGNKEGKQINLKDFKNYAGKYIKIKVNDENKFDHIFKRKKNEGKNLINLTLNFDGIFEKQELDNEVFNGEGREQFQKELDNLYDSDEESFKYYCGQSGIGKTVSLLDYRYKSIHNILYLNLNYLFTKIKLLQDFHMALKNELIYIFRSYDQYNSFIANYEKEIFLSSFEDVDINRLKFTIIENLIKRLLSKFSNSGQKFMVIIDQYIKKHDYELIDKLERYTRTNHYFKFVCCCSTDEVDVRESMYNSIFEKIQEEKKFISIYNLLKIDLSSLNHKQREVFEMFGNSPKYYYKIKNSEDKDLESLIKNLKKEIYDDIRKSIKKLNIENRVIYGLLKVMYNINKKIDKDKLKSLFDYIFLKFITITPDKTEEKYFINFWEEKEELFVLNYSFPIIKSVFKMILKEYKKKEYKQILIDCTEAEEGYILEHLIYLTLDSDEEPFKEKLKIFKSYKVDQTFCLSKIFVDSNEKEKVLNTNKDDYINGLFEIGKNYHLYQKNENGQKFDGALLISPQNNNIKEGNKFKENNEIYLEEEKDKNNEIKNNLKKKQKIFDLIIYQSTKRKVKNRVDNDFVTKNKDMIIQNFELLFNIKIRKFNFIYILEYEKKDNSLINFCEQIENQIGYIFYSLEKNIFVNKNGEEVSISKYISNIRVNKNIIKYLYANKERNEKLLKQIISNISSELDIEEGNKFLTKKRYRDKENKDYKKDNNFLCFYDQDDKLIFSKDNNKISKTIYENSIIEKKKKFFDNFIIEEDKENNNNEISDNINNSENINNQQLNIIENTDTSKNELINDIIYKERYTNEFTTEYNEKIKAIISKMYSEKTETKIAFENKNIISYYSGIYDISILNNPVNFPFYYLYRNKKTKVIKIFIKDNSEIKIFNYMDGNELNDYDFKKEINDMIDVKKFQEDNLIMFCFIVEQELKRNIKENKYEFYEYDN